MTAGATSACRARDETQPWGVQSRRSPSTTVAGTPSSAARAARRAQATGSPGGVVIASRTRVAMGCCSKGTSLYRVSLHHPEHGCRIDRGGGTNPFYDKELVVPSIGPDQ
jgi:hypothetical protein